MERKHHQRYKNHKQIKILKYDKVQRIIKKANSSN